MVWTRPRNVCCQPRKTGPMKLVSSIAARESSHQGVQRSLNPVLRVPCWTKGLISSSCDGVRSGSNRRPVAPSFVCACGADHVTTSRRRVRTITDYSLSRQTAYPCSRPPAHRARVASHPNSSILIYPVLLLLPRVMGTAISRGVGVNIAPFSCVGVPRRRGWTALSRPGRWRVFQPRSPLSTGSWFDSPCQDMILSRMMQCIKSCIEMVERRKGGTRRLDASELGTDRSRYPEST